MLSIVLKCCRNAKMNRLQSLPSRCDLLKREMEYLPIPCLAHPSRMVSNRTFYTDAKALRCARHWKYTAISDRPSLPSRATDQQSPHPTGSNSSSLMPIVFSLGLSKLNQMLPWILAFVRREGSNKWFCLTH